MSLLHKNDRIKGGKLKHLKDKRKSSILSILLLYIQNLAPPGIILEAFRAVKVLKNQFHLAMKWCNKYLNVYFTSICLKSNSSYSEIFQANIQRVS